MKQPHNIILAVVVLGFNVVFIRAQDLAEWKVYDSFREMLAEEDVHNGFLHIQSVDSSINWTFAEGAFQDRATVSKNTPFHSASIGKMLTATVVMKLVETGELQLDDYIGAHLPPEVISGLHIYEGRDYSQEITIAQLLQHTSGLPDYIMDMPRDGSPNVMTLALDNPDKQWEVEEFITFSKKKLQPHFPPGQGYYYTDTEYVLLGLIIEAKYNKELHQVFCEEFFKPLAMYHTAMFGRSSSIVPSHRMAELYVEDLEISTYQSLSIDWAGGGLVTTTEDLLKFHRALFSGELINKASLERMQEWHPEGEGIYYGLGLRKFEFKELSNFLPPLSIIGHSGATASFSFYCPELRVYLTGTFNQTNKMREAIELLVNALVVLKFDHFDNLEP